MSIKHRQLVMIGVLGVVLGGVPGILFSETVTAQAALPDIETVMNLVKQRVESVAARVETVSYRADSRTEIKNKDNKTERLVESVRLVTNSPKGSSERQFLSMRVDGRELSQEDMERELKKRLPGKIDSPFTLGELAKYDFSFLGARDFQDVSVWEIAFEPKQPGRGKMKGRAYIDQVLHEPVWMTFLPSKPPGIIKTFGAEMVLKKIGEAWMPAMLHINMHIQVNFIFTWADHVIDIREKYSEHRVREVTGSDQPDAEREQSSIVEKK